MQKRSSKPPKDLNQFGHYIVKATTEAQESQPEPPTPIREKNPHAVALGKMGGSKGGKIRAANLSKKRRSEIAKKAARARWSRGQD